MNALQQRVETWIRDQHARIFTRVPLQWKLRWWSPWNGNERKQRKRIQEEYERKKKQLCDLCQAVKADSLPDLQDLLCAMVLSECVYKRPASEMIRAVNKFKADFGGQVVCLERVQPSADHVPHRYLLAEAGDTLFASFIGTKQYKDVMTDANILQGVWLHEDPPEASSQVEADESSQEDTKNGKVEYLHNSTSLKPKQLKDIPKPAVHRGFLARAKGIPALELYRLAQKKKRKLVLCGHSLGGAVAALATLAILRVVAATSLLKENEKVQIKCITFSQPPVGNAVLRDYVHKKGWQHYFKSYCIPEDLVPRILSPAYFHHYNEQSLVLDDQAKNSQLSMTREDDIEREKVKNTTDSGGEQLVLGMGPVQSSFWRLSRLVPLEGVRKQLNKFSGKKDNMVETPSATNAVATNLIENDTGEPQSLEIQEGLNDVSLKPLSDTENVSESVETSGKSPDKSNMESADIQKWGRVPYFPQYVPFGQLYLLENSSVELLSGSEYSKLISVKSVIAELKERFQSHSMRSYRSRFQRIFDLCMNDDASAFLGAEQQQQLLHLQQWLGLSLGATVELGHIVESPVIRTATTIAPLGWRGVPGERNSEPLKVDITGFGLHLCRLVNAQVNGNWCSATVELFPSAPSYTSNHEAQPELQKLRLFIGAPLKKPPIVVDSAMTTFPSVVSDILNKDLDSDSSQEEKFPRPVGLNNVSVFFTSDFATVSKDVHIRTRRVRLLGLEGAGKTSLFKAILGRGSLDTLNSNENMLPEGDIQEGIFDGLCYCDSTGVNLQELHSEASQFRDELWRGIRDLSQKTDVIVLVHNLSHKIPRYNQSNGSQQKPALSLLLDEAKALGVPWVLAITNKFSVSAHQQRTAIDNILQAYQASPSTTEVINSCPYVMPNAGSMSVTGNMSVGYSEERVGAQKFLFAPIDLVRRPFLKKDIVLPVEGVDSLRQLVHRVLKSYEETALKELANDRLLAELAREHGMALRASRDSQDKAISAAAVGASLGAGLGVVLAVVMGAASALRKP